MAGGRGEVRYRGRQVTLPSANAATNQSVEIFRSMAVAKERAGRGGTHTQVGPASPLANTMAARAGSGRVGAHINKTDARGRSDRFEAIGFDRGTHV